jgi:hypothetical protein
MSESRSLAGEVRETSVKSVIYSVNRRLGGSQPVFFSINFVNSCCFLWNILVGRL